MRVEKIKCLNSTFSALNFAENLVILKKPGNNSLPREVFSLLRKLFLRIVSDGENQEAESNGITKELNDNPVLICVYVLDKSRQDNVPLSTSECSPGKRETFLPGDLTRSVRQDVSC
jgi:hypothetical protein